MRSAASINDEQLSHHKISDDHCQQEEGNAMVATAVHTRPHRLNPLSAEHAKHYHERVQKVFEVPARNTERKLFLVVILAEELHAHDSKYEHDDREHKAQISQRSDCPAHNADEQIECWPRPCQFEHTQLS